MKKLTKQQEKRAKKNIGKMIGEIANFLEKNKKVFINEMVKAMKIQAGVIKRARKKGINIEEMMPEVKKAYEKTNKHKAND